jgi:hypothetical protein
VANPLSVPTTSSRLLAMAVVLVGSKERVRQHMQFSLEELLNLLAGSRELTWVELDLLTTLLIEEQGSMIAANRDLGELIRRKSLRS